MYISLKMSSNIFLKGSFLLASLFILSSTTVAQTFSVGSTSVVLYDSTRDRNITTEIYYPADNPGLNEPVSAGDFPVLVFGHGFLMGWDSYQNFWTETVPNGYVICFPTTEMGIIPDHQQFGKDLKFVATQMQIEAQDSNSLFFNSLAKETGLIGHSMGGGASFLAAENNSNIHALINFAAAETTPSAISAASRISVPSLIFSGDDDCVAPPSNHQNIMYDSLKSECKTQVKIINGGHCYFANTNFNCNLGESFCNGSLDITREEQQGVTNDFLNLWLDYSLKGNQNAFTVFNDSLQTSNKINYLQQCNIAGIPNLNTSLEVEIFPNPVLEKLNVLIPIEQTEGILTMYDLVGHQVYQSVILNATNQIDISGYPNGTYFIVYTKDSSMQYHKIIKIGR